MKPLMILGCMSVLLSAPAASAAEPVNLGLFAEVTTSFVSGHETLGAVQDGFDPAGENDHHHGAYGNWPQTGTQWVEYAWSQPVSTKEIAVYWWKDGRGIDLPEACRVLAWDGSAFTAVANASGLGVEPGKYNVTTFDAVTTRRLRLEFDGKGKSSTGILEWKVIDSGASPKFPPVVHAGIDRAVVMPGSTHLAGSMKNGSGGLRWSKASGPGEVTFADAAAAETSATFSAPGAYVLTLTGGDEVTGSDTLEVNVLPPPPAAHLDPVAARGYRIDSPFWNARAQALVTTWIPHCIAKLSQPGLPEGGIENFIEAGNKNAGRPFQPHFGAPWSNAYTLNTLEAVCYALMLDPRGDARMITAQAALRETLEKWVPMILAAQEKDGYLQTRFTLGNKGEKDPQRWTHRGDHEGYVAGYFIEAAIAHLQLTEGKDRRLYDAAIRLADCWDANIGPAPKKTWFDGHQALEMALVRLARMEEITEGPGKGARHLALAKFLLDSRGGGESYDQSHLPVTRQYEALGHAVRAVYNYTAMADVAMETGDTGYHSATRAIWSNLVDRKLYVTGGVGSGETSEGFGGDYSLPNHAYCESCSGCGELFFQHRMHLAWHGAQYVNLYEDTLYNAVLGSVDLPGENFTYTNALDSGEKRYKWHVCPCCVGNIPRTLLNLPEWMYSRGSDGLRVNLYIGGEVRVDGVAGTSVTVAQETRYPWDGKVAITLRPGNPAAFALRLRVPDRSGSALYAHTPAVGGLETLEVNGSPVPVVMEDGYAVLKRIWAPGDRVTFALPLAPQRIKADERVEATRGRVALRYGPLIYNIETADGQDVDKVLAPDAPLTMRWAPDLLGGVMVMEGVFSDGSRMTAIPNHARLNRGGRSVVWIRDR